ncbi:MAG: hypothetical protein RSB35_02715 [Eubacterium sp.]
MDNVDNLVDCVENVPGKPKEGLRICALFGVKVIHSAVDNGD